MRTMLNKMEKTKEYNMGYDIVEDTKKTKANISLFELCNLPHQRKKLMESFGSQPSSTSKAIELHTEINEASIGGKSKSQTLPFMLTFEILIIMFIIVW